MAASVKDAHPQVNSYSSAHEALKALQQESAQRELEEEIVSKRDRRTLSLYSDQLSILTAELEFSDKSTRLLLALIGISEGKGEFDSSYEAIYKRLRKWEPTLKLDSGELKSTAAQTVRRYIKALEADNKRAGVHLGSILSGSKKNGRTIPTHVYLPILDCLEEIQARSKSDPSYSRASKAVRIQQTKKMVAELRAKGEYNPKKKAALKPLDKIRQMIKQTAGMLNSTVSSMKAQNYTDEAIRQWLLPELSPETKAILLSQSVEHGRGGSPDSDLTPYHVDTKVSEQKGINFDTLPKLQGEDNQGVIETENVDHLHFSTGSITPAQLELSTDPGQQADAMISAFESVGAASFDLTLKDEQGKKVDFQRAITGNRLKSDLAELLQRCEEAHINVIVRPRLSGADRLVQLDDIESSALERVKDLSLFIIETSPSNYQVWVAVENANDLICRQLKRALGADDSASGATRIAGSINFKPEYSPDYPTVKIIQINPSRVVGAGDLARSGLLADIPARHAPIPQVPRRSRVARSFPSYKRSLKDAPLKSVSKGGGPDRSWADFNFCLLALDRGHTTEAVAERLMVESERAREKGYQYALTTAQRAADVVASRQ